MFAKPIEDVGMWNSALISAIKEDIEWNIEDGRIVDILDYLCILACSDY